MLDNRMNLCYNKNGCNKQYNSKQTIRNTRQLNSNKEYHHVQQTVQRKGM